MNFSYGMVIQTNDRIGSPEIWTFQHNRWLTGGTCCFGLGRAPQNVGLNFHENLKIVKKILKICTKANSRMLKPNLKTVIHKSSSLTRFERGHAESAIVHSGLQNTQQAGGKLPFTANPILSIGCITIP